MQLPQNWEQIRKRYMALEELWYKFSRRNGLRDLQLSDALKIQVSALTAEADLPTSTPWPAGHTVQPKQDGRTYTTVLCPDWGMDTFSDTQEVKGGIVPKKMREVKLNPHTRSDVDHTMLCPLSWRIEVHADATVWAIPSMEVVMGAPRWIFFDDPAVTPRKIGRIELFDLKPEALTSRESMRYGTRADQLEAMRSLKTIVDAWTQGHLETEPSES